MNIRQKLLLSFASIIALLILVSVGALLGMKVIGDNTTSIYEDGLRPTSSLVSLKQLTENTRVSMLQSVLSEDVYFTEVAAQNLIRINNILDTYSQYDMDEERLEAYQKFVELWSLFEERVHLNIALVESGNYDEAYRGLSEGGVLFNNATGQLDELSILNESYAESLVEASHNSFNSTRTILIIFVVMSIIIGGAISILFSRYLSSNISRVVTRMQGIARGDLVAEDLQVKSKDEIAQLANGLNEMRQSLHRVVSTMSEASQQVAASSEELTASSQQSSLAAQQMAEMAQKTAEGAERQSGRMNDIFSYMQQTSKDIKHINTSSDDMMKRSKQAIEETVVGTKMVEQVTNQMLNISQRTSDTSNTIKTLEQKSEQIGEIVQLITSIANQTNLLALNASIEAAHAGELGQGFAVVAREVRKLAEQTQASSEQTSALIKEIQAETQRAVQSTDHVSEAVSEGRTTIDELRVAFERIRTTIESVSDAVQGVAESVKSMSAQTTNTVRNIEEVNHISSEIMGATQETSAASEEQLATFEEIVSASEVLAKLAEDLQLMIDRFKI